MVKWWGMCALNSKQIATICEREGDVDIASTTYVPGMTHLTNIHKDEHWAN